MYDPRYDFWWLKPLVWMWGLIVELRQTPTTPISVSWRTFLRFSAALIVIANLGLAVLLCYLIYQDPDPDGHARFLASALTFGLFGFPTTLIPIIIFGLLAHLFPANHHIAAGGLIVAYLVQWQLLAFGIYRRSQAPLL